MATPFDRLMDTIRPHLPGAIDEAVRQELFITCADFFRRSGAWQEDIEFTVAPGDSEGEVMPFAGRIERLISVRQLPDGRPIRGARLGPLDVSGVAPLYLPYPAGSNGDYEARVVVTVADPTTRDAYPIVPGELVTRYTEELIHGILARMMAQPSKPYTNVALARVHLVSFRGGISRANNAIRTGNTEGSQAWAYPQTFNRR